MKNLINEKICSWLEKCQQQITDKPIQKIIHDLHTLIPITYSLLGLIDLLKPYNNNPGHPKSLHFYSTLFDWQKFMEQRLKEQEQALSRLQEIEYPPRIEPLILMLEELVNEQLIILHVQAPSFLNIINNESFPQLLDYIAAQPIKSTHCSSILFCNNRNFAENLLRTLEAKKEQEPLANEARDLIETTLKFYTDDMHLVEISLEGKCTTVAKEEVPPPKKRCCIL